MQFKLGGNKAYYFNHSLPFSAKEQTDAHYLTTVIMSLAGALILLCYYDIPASGEINGVNMTTPLFFIAINLIGHAIAFPKCSEIRRDFIPYWGFVVVMNLIMPFVITFAMFGVVRITKPMKMTDSFINNFINGAGVLLLILSLAFFSFTYLKQLRRIKNETTTLKEVILMKLEHITKQYGDNKVLNDIDFNFDDSRIVGLIGKNGVGKTTLMKIMNGNIINYKGKVDLSPEDRVGYLIEHPKLYDNKTGLYNLKIFAQVLGKGFDKAYAQKLSMHSVWHRI